MFISSPASGKKTAFRQGWVMLFFFLLALQATAGKLTVQFRNPQSTFKANELCSNMLRVLNGTGKSIRFTLGLNLPDGWTSIKPPGTVYNVDAGDSLFIPVKVTPKGKEEGSISYLVSANLLSESDHRQFASASWYVQIKMESEWNAAADKTEAFFLQQTDTASFSVSVRNTGNSSENFTLRLMPHFQLHVWNVAMTEEIKSFFNFNLEPGADTLITMVVKSLPLQQDAYANPGRTDENEQAEKFPLRLSVQAAGKDGTPGRTWKATIDFKRNRNEVRFHEYSRRVLPLTAEMRLDNLFDAATAMSLNLYGMAPLSRGRSLSYRYQSFFTDSYFGLRSFKGNYHYIGYFTPRAGIEAGNITGWTNFGFTPSGRGARGEYSLGKNKIGWLYIQNPDLFLANTNRAGGIHHEYAQKKYSVVNYYQQSWNSLSRMDGKLFTTGLNLRLGNQHIVSLRGGWSDEYYYAGLTPFSKSGMGGSLNYTGTVRRFNLHVASTYGTPTYSGYRGIANASGSLMFRQNERYTWTFSTTYYRQAPDYFDINGNLLGSYQSRSTKYELRYGIREKTSNYGFRAAYQSDDFINIRYQTRGLGFDYHPISRSDVRFVSTVFGSFVKLTDYEIPDYFTAQVRTSFKYKSFTTNVRYNYGPYQAYEQLRFATYKINHQSVNINSFYGIWLRRNVISMEPSLNYSYETLYKKSLLSMRPEIYYFTKSGWQFNMYGQYLINSQKITTLDSRIYAFTTEEAQQGTRYSDFIFGFGVKKQFGIPLPGKKYQTVQVTIFRDLNGNGKKDKNEEALENVLITLKPVTIDTTGERDDLIKERGEQVMSDAKGSVSFRNLPQGNYILTAKALQDNSGWFPGMEQEILLDKSKEVLMPFSKGVRLIGSVAVDHNVFASGRNKEPDLGRIRVSALDSSGKTYSCLTGNDGRFELFVPAGEYRVSINQKAIEDNYQLDQNSIPVELLGGIEAFHISFHLREKERQVKVKRFGSDGSEIK